MIGRGRYRNPTNSSPFYAHPNTPALLRVFASPALLWPHVFPPSRRFLPSLSRAKTVLGNETENKLNGPAGSSAAAGGAAATHRHAGTLQTAALAAASPDPANV